MSSADGLGMYARALALMLSGTRERAPVTPNARQQLAEETNVALLCTIRPRTKVIESVWWQGASVLGERRLYVPEKKDTAQRGERTEEDVLVPLHHLIFQHFEPAVS